MNGLLKKYITRFVLFLVNFSFPFLFVRVCMSQIERALSKSNFDQITRFMSSNELQYIYHSSSCKYLMASNKNIDTYRDRSMESYCVRTPCRRISHWKYLSFVQCSHVIWIRCVPHSKKIHVCFYHNFKFYLCCELCGGDDGNNDNNYDGVFSYDFIFCACEKRTYGIAHDMPL